MDNQGSNCPVPPINACGADYLHPFPPSSQISHPFHPHPLVTVLSGSFSFLLLAEMVLCAQCLPFMEEKLLSIWFSLTIFSFGGDEPKRECGEEVDQEKQTGALAEGELGFWVGGMPSSAQQ